MVDAAGRLFAEWGYHGTSMRDLGRELGLLGSSLYAHVDSKQDLLVEVVEAGARLFEASAGRALACDGASADRLRALISGHVDVVLDNPAVARTFLNEARTLDEGRRAAVTEMRDHYEAAFRATLERGAEDGSFRDDVDSRTYSIFILSILNAVERWYSPRGEMSRRELVEELSRFALSALRPGGL